MNKVLIILSIALATAYAIPPQVRHGPPSGGAFAGAQDVPSAPTVRLSHPLPPSSSSTRDGRYTGVDRDSSSSSTGTGSYGGSSASSSSSSSFGSGNRYESTNRVSSYAPPASSSSNYAPAPAPVQNNYVKTGSNSNQNYAKTRDNEITILKSSYEDNQDGHNGYSYSFENSDGTKTEQKGYFKNPGTENEIFVQEGSYQYYAPDGQLYTVTYISDENGYQPSGAHLPAIPQPVRSSDTGNSAYGSTARPAYGGASSSSSSNNYNNNFKNNNNYNNNNNNRNRYQ